MEEIFEKMENAKVTGTGLLNAPKDTRKVEISIDPYNVEGVQKGVLYHRKGEEITLILTRKSKILST